MGADIEKQLPAAPPGLDAAGADVRERPSYYAIIPAPVRYDERLTPNAKLLYGEISALIGAEGYCYASNGYFADVYKFSERTVTSLIANLKENGYIAVQLVKDKSGKVCERKIWLSSSVTDGQPVEEIFYTPRKYFREGIENIFQYTNTSNTNKENIKEKSPKKKKGAPKEDFDPKPLFVEWIGQAFGDGIPAEKKNALYLAMVRLAENRQALKKPMASEATVKALCNKLIKLTKDSVDQIPAMIDLLDTATVSNWLTVFPPRNGQSPAPPKQEREWEEL